MEDVLDLYAAPLDPQRPVVCYDERPTQLISEVRVPRPATPGTRRKVDYAYRREGTCNVLGLFQPLTGWRHMTVTAQRTRQDFAHCMRTLVDEHVPDATTIRVVLDNLNTHTYAALYATFAPAEARRIATKLELHYTPKHGSWSGTLWVLVEIEFSVLARQCLNQRIPTMTEVSRRVAQWQLRRNAAQVRVDWRFSVLDARTKLADLYPSTS